MTHSECHFRSVPRLHRGLLALAVAALLLGGQSPAQAQRRGDRDRDEFLRSSPKVLAAFHDVVAGPSKSVVRVKSGDKDVALGTVVAADGLILTKYSELDKAPKCELPDGRVLAATVVGVEESHDLALLKVDAKDLTPVEWKSSKLSAPGDWVASAGTDEEPVGIGIISVGVRKMKERDYPRETNTDGARLGVYFEEVADGGVRVTQVERRSAADRAGLKAADIILSLNAKPVANGAALRDAIQSFKPGDKVTLRIKRGDEEIEREATLGKPRLSRGEMQNRMGGDLSDKKYGFPIILQHDTFLSPKDCGGPLVNLDGKAVGINISRAGRTETYAIPSDTVLSLLDDLRSGKLAPKKTEEKVSEKKD